jgi:hypothetical protein
MSNRRMSNAEALDVTGHSERIESVAPIDPRGIDQQTSRFASTIRLAAAPTRRTDDRAKPQSTGSVHRASPHRIRKAQNRKGGRRWSIWSAIARVDQWRQRRSGIGRSMAAPIRCIAVRQTLKGQKTPREAPDLYGVRRVRQCDAGDGDVTGFARRVTRDRAGHVWFGRVLCGRETCRLVRQARNDQAKDVEAQTSASMTLLYDETGEEASPAAARERDRIGQSQ